MRAAVAVSFVLALALLAGHARADHVYLAGGTVIEGKATRQGDKVVVELESGAITLPADTVERIESAESDVQRFEAMYAKISPTDVKGLLGVANFCRDHDMADRERQVLQKIIEVSPEHAEARARLGYVHTEAGWIKREDQLRAQGMIKRDGHWVTPQEALELERLQAQTEAAAHERDKAQAELETKRVELASQEAQLERARAASVEEQNRAQEASQMQPAVPAYYTPFYGGYGYAPVGVRPGRGYGGYGVVGAPHGVVHRSSFPISGVQDPWVYIRDPHGYPRN